MSLSARFLMCAVLVAAGCSDDGGSAIDAAVGSPDASVGSIDAAAADGAVADATVADAGSSDASDLDATSACHALGFGATAVTSQQVGSLPTMTGGVIALGAYDAVGFQTTSTTIAGSYRASWYFDSATTMQLLEQLALSGTPPVPVPRTLSWSTSAANLTRTQICGPNSNTFDNGYTVRVAGPDTFLDVRQGGIMFTFKKRP